MLLSVKIHFDREIEFFLLFEKIVVNRKIFFHIDDFSRLTDSQHCEREDFIHFFQRNEVECSVGERSSKVKMLCY